MTPASNFFPQGLEPYQPALLPSGSLPGRRPCEDRFQLLLPYLQDGWSVLDVGSNFGYFERRLLAERPNSVCLSIEADPRACHVQRQVLEGTPSCALLQGRLDRSFLERLNATPESFDLALLLSVLHHIPADDLLAVCLMLDQHTARVAIEFPASGDREACGGVSLQRFHALGLQRLFPSKEFHQVGLVKNHLNDSMRELWWGETPRHVGRGTKAYWGSVFPKSYTLVDRVLYTIARGAPLRATPWVPGFNPYTWTHLGPLLYPSRQSLLEQLRREFQRLDASNTDVRPWNLIFGSRGLEFIDVTSSREWEGRNYSPDDIRPIEAWLDRVALG